MRCILLFLLLLTVLEGRGQQPSSAVPSPDVLLRVDGQELNGRVLLITPDVVRLLPFTDGRFSTDTLTLPRPEIFLIRFADGRKEVLQEVVVQTESALTPAELTARAKSDVQKHFRTKKAFWGTYSATVVPMLAGGAGVLTGAGVATAVSFTPPKTSNLQAPSPELLQNPVYNDAYRRAAKRKKAASAVGGYAAGLGTTLAVGLAVVLVYLSGY